MKSLCKGALQGFGWLLMTVGGLSFWVGGKAISEFAKVDRILAEMVGILIAVVFIALGYALKSAGAADEAPDDEGSSSEDSSTRK